MADTTVVATNYVIEPITDLTAGATTTHWQTSDGDPLPLELDQGYGLMSEGLALTADMTPLYIALDADSLAPGDEYRLTVRFTEPLESYQKPFVIRAGLSNSPYDYWESYGTAVAVIPATEVVMEIGPGDQVVTSDPIAIPAQAFQYLAIYGDDFSGSGSSSGLDRLSLTSAAAVDAGLDMFTGDSEPIELNDETVSFRWTGEPNESESEAYTVAAPVEPDPDDGDPGQGSWIDTAAERVAKYIDREGDTETIELAKEHLDIVATYCYGYTRGKGFTGDNMTPKPDLRNVIIGATARLTPNPEQLKRYEVADYSETGPILNGWTLLEQAVLHNYRKRWA